MPDPGLFDVRISQPVTLQLHRSQDGTNITGYDQERQTYATSANSCSSLSLDSFPLRVDPSRTFATPPPGLRSFAPTCTLSVSTSNRLRCRRWSGNSCQTGDHCSPPMHDLPCHLKRAKRGQNPLRPGADLHVQSSPLALHPVAHGHGVPHSGAS